MLTPGRVPRGRPAGAGHATARTFRGLADDGSLTVTKAETLTTTMTAGTVADAVAAAAIAGIAAGVSTGVAATRVAAASTGATAASATAATSTAATTATAATSATTAAAAATTATAAAATATTRQRGSGRHCDDSQNDHECTKEVHVAVSSFGEGSNGHLSCQRHDVNLHST